MNAKSDRLKSAETAEKLAKAGRLPEAVAEYEKLLEDTAQDIPLRNIMGDLYIRMGREDKAVKLFRANVAALENQGAYSQALALCKRVFKLVPTDVETVVKMGDLYSLLGFSGEAKAEFVKAAEILGAGKAYDALVPLYEKLIGLDRGDVDIRLKLAGLLVKTGRVDRAAVELNETADLLFTKGDTAEAERVLQEARKLKDGDSRTLASLSRILVREKRTDEAIAMVDESVHSHGPQPALVALLGDLLLNARKDDRAREVFGRILEENPENADARAKLGVLALREGRPDEAYALYEPLVVSLVSRSKEEQASGLLGLILLAFPAHLPSLEKLVSIFRRGGRAEFLETVLRSLLQENKRRGRDEAYRKTAHELADLCPSDRELQKLWKSLRKLPEKKDAEEVPARGQGLSQKDEDIVRTNLAKVDLYVDQGLVRNARRILENLILLYPDDPRIAEKIESLPKEKPPATAEDASRLVDQIVAKEPPAARAAPPETEAREEPKMTDKPAAPAEPAAPPEPTPEPVLQAEPEPTTGPEPVAEPAPPVNPEPAAEPEPIAEPEPPEPPAPEAPPERIEPEIPVEPPAPLPKEPAAPSDVVFADIGFHDTVSLDEIFGGIDFGPTGSTRTPTVLYPDLTEKIREEMDALETAFYKQIKEKTAVIEKDLGEIVSEFKRQVEARIAKSNFDALYNLGLAFLEQGLYDEAIDEFKLAAKDPPRAADCYALISQCYKRRRNFREALRWIDEAMRLTTAGTDEDYALTYERADLLENLADNAEALAHFRKVKVWNSRYRDVSKRVKILEKIT